jgi:hypothetical protein
MIGAAAVAALALSGCMNDSIRDYEEAEVRDPDHITLWNSVDLHPNIARTCTDGVAWATTSRDFTAIIRVPEWDDFCATQGDRPSRNTD